MRLISEILFGLFIVLLGCKVEKQNVNEEYPIPDLRLVDYETSDIGVNRAITKVRDYLEANESDVKINDFYLDSIYVKSDTVVMMINHVDYYETWRAMKMEERRQKELEAKGDTLFEIFVPPTGNWSGRDRTILYLMKKDSIIDILYQ